MTSRLITIPKTTLQKVIANKKNGKGIRCSSSIAANSYNDDHSFRWFAHQDDATTRPVRIVNNDDRKKSIISSKNGANWSGTMSYASAESDFVASDRFVDNESSSSFHYNSEWSNTMSFASAESDFVASDRYAKNYNKSEWSNTMSFASAESDFVASDRYVKNYNKSEWSNTMSFASAESDFVASDQFVDTTKASSSHSYEWSKQLSYASPESDFVATNVPEAVNESSSSHTGAETEWSQQMSFATPMSDFTFQATNGENDANYVNDMKKDERNFLLNKLSLMSSSPETALGAIHNAEFMDKKSRNEFYQAIDDNDVVATALFPQEEQDNIPNQEFIDSLLLMSSPESAAGAVHYQEFLTPSELEQYRMNIGLTGQEQDEMYPHEKLTVNDPTLHMDSLSLMSSSETAFGAVHYGEYLSSTELDEYVTRLSEQEEVLKIMPQTMKDVLVDDRPIVVTSMQSPFTVVQVNDAWVGLCGYTREEALDRNLGSMLQGDDTDLDAVQEMLSTLRTNHYSEAKLTNYTKSGRKFQNHLKVSILSTDDKNGNEADEKNEQFFVGVLEEILSSPEKEGKKANL